METYTAVTNAVGGSLGLSALVATIPLLTFFVMLLGVKARAHWSALRGTGSIHPRSSAGLPHAR